DPAFEPFLQRVETFLGVEAPKEGAALPEVADLTPREREVLDLLARGLDNRSMAKALFVTPKTVRNHVSRIFAKLGVGHRGEAVVRGRELGFGRNPGPASHDPPPPDRKSGTSAS
ncbi:MAG TPA: helix-turn-helix transcriptional regulator, partial [Longimicrobiales bacterium]|nr:helix-turn-helix transcriptional regulator [Longimicrobiales bacterium]